MVLRLLVLSVGWHTVMTAVVHRRGLVVLRCRSVMGVVHLGSRLRITVVRHWLGRGSVLRHGVMLRHVSGRHHRGSVDNALFTVLVGRSSSAVGLSLELSVG